MLDLKNVGLSKAYILRFDAISMFKFEKNMLWRFLIYQLPYSENDEYRNTKDHSLLSVLYMYDLFF